MALPSKATASVLGEVLLSGDLTGSGASPQLASSGVVAGSYPVTKTVSVDSKGRITSIGALTQAESDALVDAAYASNPSAFTIVGDRPVLTVPDASDTVAGYMTVGTNLQTINGQLSLKEATTSVLGGVKVGNGLKITAGSLAMDDTQLLGTTGGTVNARLQPGPVANFWSTTTPTVSAVSAVSIDSGSGSTTFPGVVSYWKETGITLHSPITSAAASNGTRIVQVFTDVTGEVQTCYTENGEDWVQNLAPVGMAVVKNMTYDAVNGRFIAVAYNSGMNCTAYWSTDGVTWSASVSAISFNGWYIASGGGTTVIVGTNGSSNLSAAKSTDGGTTWVTTTTANSFPSGLYAGIVFDGTVFCVTSFVYNTWKIYTSTDGVTWTSQTGLGSLMYPHSISTNGSGTMVIVGLLNSPQAARIWYSTDHGVSWSVATVPSSLLTVNASFWHNGAFYACATGAASAKSLVTSTTGTTWTTATSSPPWQWFSGLSIGTRCVVPEGYFPNRDFDPTAFGTSTNTSVSVPPLMWSDDCVSWSVGFGTSGQSQQARTHNKGVARRLKCVLPFKAINSTQIQTFPTWMQWNGTVSKYVFNCSTRTFWVSLSTSGVYGSATLRSTLGDFFTKLDGPTVVEVNLVGLNGNLFTGGGTGDMYISKD